MTSLPSMQSAAKHFFLLQFSVIFPSNTSLSINKIDSYKRQKSYTVTELQMTDIQLGLADIDRASTKDRLANGPKVFYHRSITR